MRGNLNKFKTELLAPAKDKETAFNAIDCGADAVYIGANSFGARKNASNSLDDIKEVVDYAHKFWAKVFVTMNTILTDSELKDAVEMAKKLAKIGVDALIIQDMGLLNELMKITPPQPSPSREGACLPPIHMSTQCDNYLPQKVKFFNEMGVSRVILARELSIEQIKEIHKQNPDLELEAFVHGALCVSMSGQCYLSEYIGGRSANRGECAQPCRKKYSVETTEGEIIKKDFYALCLKDFNASNSLKELINAGICSFKIEGRLKDSGYVKNIVAYYREKLGKGCSSGRSVYSFIPNPEKSFNRGFTEYFLNGRTNCFNQESPKSKGEYLGEVVEVKKDCFKLKTDKTIHTQDGIYFRGDGFAVNKVVTQEYNQTRHCGLDPQTQNFENNAIPHQVRYDILIYPNKQIQIKVGDKLWRNLDVEFEKELQKPVKRQIRVSIKVIDNEIILIDEDDVTITYLISQGEKANNPDKMKDNFIKQFSKTGESDFYVGNIEVNSDLPFMPVSEINKLRRDLFNLLMQERIKYYNENKQWQKTLKYTKYFTDELDYRANVHNNFAKEFYEKSGVNIKEISFESNKPNRQVELMRCKHCIKYALNMCKSSKKLVLRDEKGKIFPLKFDCQKCEMSILSPN